MKEASFYGVTSYKLSMKLVALNPERPIPFTYMGIREDTMFPAIRPVSEQSPHLRQTLEHLDNFLNTTTGGSLDVLMMSCIAGVIEV